MRYVKACKAYRSGALRLSPATLRALTEAHTWKKKGIGETMKAFEKKMDGKYNVRIDKFSGIDELIKFIERTPADEGFTDMVNGTHSMRREFNGAASYAEAREYIKKGVNIKDIAVAINTGNRDYSKKSRTRHICGGAPCVPAAVGSDPRAMYQKRNELITGAYNIFVNCGVNCGVKPREIKYAGIEILKEVLRISAIKPVNLYVGALAIDSPHRNVIGYGMQIMDAGKSFNVARVSYALTEAGFFRTFGFAMYQRSRGMWSPSENGTLGYPLANVEPELNKRVMEGAFKNMLYVNMVDVIRDKHSALKELEAIK